ncbi:glycerol-3-phosphate acyltransferase PlsY [Priestia taiwanensis]|uniref:Glycerol-3-phosphate acyltransferase n=2 Tax=Priestia taiwanensis TaxID=1347902 RepID=A0A917ANU4_9BACI|nr:glycerol-3-phosphate acyltransferase PlsY [Priestia taiwanensis]GGE62535.1 glycerol-3-phosphate acyltransferase 2 [Priestia taiwanensis]
MIFLLIILGYLLGSIPSGLIVGKLGYGTDIRDHGSGNLGGTNTFRTLGKKAGFIVTIADILKGTIATLLPWLLQVDVNPLFIGTCAVIGHMYPLFAGFRGGKAVATSAGVILGYTPIIFIILFFVFMGCLLTTKYVSLSSMLTSVAAIIASVIKHLTQGSDIPLIIIMSLLAAFVFYRHRANIGRILKKTEPKVKLFKS